MAETPAAEPEAEEAPAECQNDFLHGLPYWLDVSASLDW
jgi:hypothetical protein